MKKIPLFVLGMAAFVCTTATAFAAPEQTTGFVNFKKCVEKSKQGNQEKNAYESLAKQMTEALQKTDKELEDLQKKLEDQDYMDGLSPTAEGELKQRFQALSQEFARYQNQYYQLLNQAKLRMAQSLHEVVSAAAEKVREHHKLNFIFNEDSTFASAPALNFTDEVIQEMDALFDVQNGSQTASVGHAEK